MLGPSVPGPLYPLMSILSSEAHLMQTVRVVIDLVLPLQSRAIRWKSLLQLLVVLLLRKMELLTCRESPLSSNAVVRTSDGRCKTRVVIVDRRRG